MNLLDQSRIDEIFARALDRGLARRRERLLQGLGNALIDSLEVSSVPADQLRFDLRDLNLRFRLIDDQLPLARWLRAAGDILAVPHPSDAAFFYDEADSIVMPAAPTITEVARDARESILKVRESAGGRLAQALAAARNDLSGLLDRLFLLAVSKRFHDILHKFQMERLPSIQNQMTRDIVRDPQRRLGLARELKALTAPLSELRRTLEDLEGKPDHDGAQSWIDAFDGHRAALETALAAGSYEGVASGLRGLRYMVKSSMSDLNLALGDASLLPIRDVADSLREVAGQVPDRDDPNATRLRETATKLVELQKEIELLVRTHHAWQQYDDVLWQLEGNLIFDASSPDALANFEYFWGVVIKRLVRLAGEPAEDWFEEVSQHRALFEESCPRPIVPPLAENARFAFSNFTWATRQQFLELDGRLDGRCKQLVSIARPLSELVKSP